MVNPALVQSPNLTQRSSALTWYTERCARPRSVITLRLFCLVRESVVTAIVQLVAVVDERSHVETRLQRTILHRRHLALAYNHNTNLYFAKYRSQTKPRFYLVVGIICEGGNVTHSGVTSNWCHPGRQLMVSPYFSLKTHDLF